MAKSGSAVSAARSRITRRTLTLVVAWVLWLFLAAAGPVTAGQPHISYYDDTNGDLEYSDWPGSGWDIQVVDSEGDVGEDTSLALDADGWPHISYHDPTNGDLKYARWAGWPGGWDIQTMDSYGAEPSLALDAAGQPHISYVGSGGLKYAHWTGSAWEIQTVDSEDGGYTSLALDAAGRPHVSYWGGFDVGLKYARWTGSEWDVQTVDVDSGYAVDIWTSLALDAAGQPHISYTDVAIGYDAWDGDLKYARWTGGAWEIQTVDSEANTGWFTSLALDATGRPHIGYREGSYYGYGLLKYARWTGDAWEIQTVDGEGGGFMSLALDAASRPHISYWGGFDAGLKYARWTGSVWQIETVDDEGVVGQWTSLALDALGQPHISYYDETNGDLKYAYHMGPALSASSKRVEPRRAGAGERITYTLQIVSEGSGSTAFSLNDPVPAHTTYVPGSAWASSGQISDAGSILWTGTITAGTSLTATFAVTIDGGLTQPTAIINEAMLEGDPDGPLTLRAGIIVDAYEYYFPLILRSEP